MSLRLLLLSFIAAGLGFGADLSVFSISDLVGPSAHTTLAASISNVGTSTAVTADVTFYRGSVIAGNATQINTQTVLLRAFANTRVTSPEISTAEGELYSVCVDTAQAVPESNENNNCDVRAVPTSAGDLSITTAGVTMTPAGADVGEPIRVTPISKMCGTWRAAPWSGCSRDIRRVPPRSSWARP